MNSDKTSELMVLMGLNMAALGINPDLMPTFKTQTCAAKPRVWDSSLEAKERRAREHREIQQWNAEVDRRKAEKREKKGLK